MSSTKLEQSTSRLRRLRGVRTKQRLWVERSAAQSFWNPPGFLHPTWWEPEWEAAPEVMVAPADERKFDSASMSEETPINSGLPLLCFDGPARHNRGTPFGQIMIGLQSLGEHLGDILHGIKPIGGVKDDGVNCAIEKPDLSVEASLEGYEIEEPAFPIMVTGVFGDNAFYNVRPTEQLLEDSNNEYLICLAKAIKGIAHSLVKLDRAAVFSQGDYDDNGSVLPGHEKDGWPNNFENDYDYNEHLNLADAEESEDMEVQWRGHLFIFDRPLFWQSVANATANMPLRDEVLAIASHIAPASRTAHVSKSEYEDWYFSHDEAAFSWQGHVRDDEVDERSDLLCLLKLLRKLE